MERLRRPDSVEEGKIGRKMLTIGADELGESYNLEKEWLGETWSKRFD